MRTNNLARDAHRLSQSWRAMSPARERAEVARILTRVNARLDQAEKLADQTLAELKEMAKKRR